jgi:glycosyltransferase involved in cell wall biosynthesis
LPPGVRHLAYFFLLLLHAFSVDAIVAMDTVSVGLPATLVARISGRPFIVRVPGDYAWEQGTQRFRVIDSLDQFQRKTYTWRVQWLRRVQYFVARSASLVLVPSHYFEGIVRQWGIAPSRIRCVYLGVEIPSVIELPENLPSGRLMISVGRLVPWKGFSMLIDFLPLLPEWRLIILGDGPLRASLEKQAVRVGVQDRILFMGSVPHSEILRWCKAADVFVLNTSFESFSFQIVEAMMIGVPIITTHIGSIPELLENDTEGVLLTPDDSGKFKDAITSIVSQPERWEKRVTRAREKAEEDFSIDTAMGALAHEIERVCT